MMKKKARTMKHAKLLTMITRPTQSFCAAVSVGWLVRRMAVMYEKRIESCAVVDIRPQSRPRYGFTLISTHTHTRTPEQEHGSARSTARVHSSGAVRSLWQGTYEARASRDDQAKAELHGGIRDDDEDHTREKPFANQVYRLPVPAFIAIRLKP